MDAAHPLRVAARQVVVDRDDVDALPGQRVQVGGERRDEGLAFAGPHLGDPAFVQHHPADELDVEVPHPQDPLAGLADDGERLGEEIVEGRPCAIRARNSSFLARRSSSESAAIAGSSALIRSTMRPEPLQRPLVLRADDLRREGR